MDLQLYQPIIEEITTRFLKGVLAELRKSPAMIPPALMNAEVAGHYMGTSAKAILHRRQTGSLPGYTTKMGKSVMFIRAELDKVIVANKED